MSKDEALVGKLPDGRRFISILRDGRKMPVLDNNGDIVMFSPREERAARMYPDAAFRRMLNAMNEPDKLKVVS